MIIQEQSKDLIVIGEDSSRKATISENKLAKLQYLLTKGLYKDPITAVIAEWTNNGIDSVVQAGKDPIENPVLVKIEKGAQGQYVLKVEDKGTGLDDNDFENICMNYLESTKEENNDTIGHFGIGMKSFLALDRSAVFTCRKDGIERKYLVYEGREFVNYDLLYQKETTEENGVIAELQILSYTERSLFFQKAKQKLAYYDTAVLIVDGVVVENKIYRNELFQWSEFNSNTSMHLCLKDVYYPIDWEALDIKNALPLGIALRFELTDGLIPTPSRESYISNEKTKALILNRIKEVADWFINKYNETVKEFSTFLEAYQFLGQSICCVNINTKQFVINDLVHYSTIKVLNPKVKGITFNYPVFYKLKKGSLLFEWIPVAYVNDRGVMKSKQTRLGVSKEWHVFDRRAKTVEVGDNFKGNVKEFLKQKHGPSTLYVRRSTNPRRLGSLTDTQGFESYRFILDLPSKPKSVWRDHIKEFNFVAKSVADTFIDAKNVETSNEYIKWLEQKRRDQKLQRASGSKGSYIGLGKQAGDVTLAYSYQGYGNRIFFKKEAFPIKELTDNRYLTVLLTKDDDLEVAKDIILCLKEKVRIRFALVGTKEIKKIPNHYQFINFQQFMSRDCKPFMRLASSMKFKELLEEYDKVSNYNHVVFADILKTFRSSAQKLRGYVRENMIYVLDTKVQNVIIDVADAYDLYDKSLWTEYVNVKEGVRKYDFMNLITPPVNTNNELTKRYETLVNQILLFRKKYYDDLPEGAKIVFEPVENKTNENEMV